MITGKDILIALTKKRQKNRFKHKTKYGRSLEQSWCYDRQEHQKHFNSIKNDSNRLFKDLWL
jgi:hypothetical protein